MTVRESARGVVFNTQHQVLLLRTSGGRSTNSLHRGRRLDPQSSSSWCSVSFEKARQHSPFGYMFHLTSEKNGKRIERVGIRCRRSPSPDGRVVFAMPVTRNYYISHQWLRELKRGGQRTLIAVHFRIPDEQAVMVGHYGKQHALVTAAQAAAMVASAQNSEGYEVLIPRRIDASEIHAIREVKQVTGWRYFPGAHGTRPWGCPYCQRGQVGAKKLRARYEAGFARE